MTKATITVELEGAVWVVRAQVEANGVVRQAGYANVPSPKVAEATAVALATMVCGSLEKIRARDLGVVG